MPSLAFSFAALAVLVAILFIAGQAWAARRLGHSPRAAAHAARLSFAGTAAWMALTAAAAASGVLARFDEKPPPLLGLFVGVIAVSSAVGFSGVGARLMHGLPLAALVGFHAFRLPLELLMHRAAVDGVMPVQMSFSGWNFDIVTGATAMVVALFAAFGRAPRALVMSWNALGIVLLTVILGLALVSTPAVHAFGTDPKSLNTFVAYFPFVWLPAVLVVAAIIGHIVLTRRLLADH